VTGDRWFQALEKAFPSHSILPRPFGVDQSEHTIRALAQFLAAGCTVFQIILFGVGEGIPVGGYLSHE
jgi:hypothetical protein